MPWPPVQELVGEKLKGYEREHKELNITLFPEVGHTYR
jgi:hypothetical protein